MPVIIPVSVLRESPAGRAGDTEYETGVPPEEVGDNDVIAVPLIYILGDEYDKEVGAMSLIVMTTLKVAVPPLFVAVTV